MPSVLLGERLKARSRRLLLLLQDCYRLTTTLLARWTPRTSCYSVDKKMEALSHQTTRRRSSGSLPDISTKRIRATSVHPLWPFPSTISWSLRPLCSRCIRFESGCQPPSQHLLQHTPMTLVHFSKSKCAQVTLSPNSQRDRKNQKHKNTKIKRDPFSGR